MQFLKPKISFLFYLVNSTMQLFFASCFYLLRIAILNVIIKKEMR
nr:MAG TPA: CAMPATH-1 antigen [Caudoviricetes sp.]